MQVTMQALDELMQSDTAISGALRHVKEKEMTHEQLRAYFSSKYAPKIRAHMAAFDAGALFFAQIAHFTSWVKRSRRMEDMEKFYEVKGDFEMAGLPLDDRLQDFAYARLYRPLIVDEMKPLFEVEGSSIWNSAALEWSNVNRTKHWLWNAQ